jgi:hypothetical protein
MQQSVDRSLALQSSNPSVDPEQLRSFTNSVIYGSLGFGAVAGAVLVAIVVIGIVRLWRWVYWYLVVSYLVAVLSIPQNIVYSLGLGPVSLPGWWLLISIPPGTGGCRAGRLDDRTLPPVRDLGAAARPGLTGATVTSAPPVPAGGPRARTRRRWRSARGR